ncbi:MAG: hypothetical protein U0Q12_10790 [Vicinamibacterales bacterium]
MRSHHWIRASVVAGVAAGAAAHGATAHAQRSSLDELLFRANQYVVNYQAQVSGFIIEEDYDQRIVRASGEVKQHRTLKSDYILVSMPGDSAWRGYRDVYEVDGAPVRDRQERLADIFVKSADNAYKQASRVINESARYNIGQISRNFNLPTMSLAFLDPINQHRFSFELLTPESIDGESAVVVRYSEHHRPTFIQVPPANGRVLPMSVFSRGRFWLSPTDGRVIKSEMTAGDDKVGVRLTITVSYRLEPTLKMWLPDVMEERYDDPRVEASDVILGVAKYTNYRKLFAKTDFTVK